MAVQFRKAQFPIVPTPSVNKTFVKDAQFPKVFCPSVTVEGIVIDVTAVA